MEIIGIVVIVFTVITVGIGFWSYYKVKGKAINYYKAGAAMPVWVIGITLCAQAFDANGSVGTVSLGYGSGFWSGAAIPIGLALALILTGLFIAKPLHKMNLMTLPDFFNRRYSQKMETFAVLSMLLTNIVLIAGNLAGLGLLYSMVFGASYLPMLILIASCILAYALTGGMHASISTSVMQVAVFIIAMLIAFVYMINHYGWDPLMASIPADHINFSGLTDRSNGSIVNWASLISLALGNMVAIDFIQRVISSDSPKTAQRGCYSAAGLTLAVGIPTALIGLFAFHMKGLGLDLGDVESQLLINIAKDHLPQFIGILVLLGIISASMSTAAGVILALANIITRNLVQKNLKKPWNDNKMLRFSRLIALPTMAAAILFAYIRPEPGTLLILAFDIALSGCVVPLVLGIYWEKANTAGALASILVGSTARLILHYTIPEGLAGMETLLPPVISLLAFVGVSLATQKSHTPKPEALLYRPTEEELLEGK